MKLAVKIVCPYFSVVEFDNLDCLETMREDDSL